MLKFQPLCLQKVTQDIAKNSFGLVLAQVLQVVLELVEKRARFQQEINRDTSDTFHWVFLSFFFFFLDQFYLRLHFWKKYSFSSLLVFILHPRQCCVNSSELRRKPTITFCLSMINSMWNKSSVTKNKQGISAFALTWLYLRHISYYLGCIMLIVKKNKTKTKTTNNNTGLVNWIVNNNGSNRKSYLYLESQTLEWGIK